MMKSTICRNAARKVYGDLKLALPMCRAAWTGNRKEIMELSKSQSVNVRNHDGRTPLHFAARAGHINIVNFLIEEGADVTSKDVKGNTPFVAALLAGNAPVQSALHQAGGGLRKPQMEAVFSHLVKSNVFTPRQLWDELDLFYNKYGIAPWYFEQFRSDEIAQHLLCFVAGKKAGEATDNIGNAPFADKGERRATFFSPNTPALRERMFHDMKDYCAGTPKDLATDIAYMEAQNAVEGHKIIFGFVSRSPYLDPGFQRGSVVDVEKMGSQEFLTRTSPLTRDWYYEMLKQVEKGILYPLDKVALAQHQPKGALNGKVYSCVMVFPSQKAASNPLLEMLQVTNFLNLHCTDMFAHEISNGSLACHVMLAPRSRTMPDRRVEAKIKQFVRYVSNMYIMPRTSSSLPGMRTMERLYFGCASLFTYYFMPHASDDFQALRKYLQDHDPAQLNRLNALGRQMQKDAVGSHRFAETRRKYPGLSKLIYNDFRVGRDPEREVSDVMPPFNEKLAQRIEKDVHDPLDQQILKCCLLFNNSVLKTNFYNSKKAATAFRLRGSVIGKEFPEVPYGLFLVAGADFHGFHIRFRDIARGGIRLIPSPKDTYLKNLNSLVNENYNLAYTQQFKNKDIPEGGSKGTVLLNPGDAQNNPEGAFYSFIDALLDLMVYHPQVVDRLGKSEILFFGPDEGTAGVMDWAAFHGKRRGYPYWKAITTGKPPSLGGIPHDVYGMTTRSVRQQFLGLLRVYGMKEEEVTKVQTGGPDGDLGSNEILMSNDKTIAVVDGAGVVFDPNGLDRAELIRLAKKRVMVSQFNEEKLGADGYKVLVDDKNVTLPNGEFVESGFNFRNLYHLREDLTADFFVPCGGRPESIQIDNVHEMFKKDGTPRFPFIVEGANLFCTPDARTVLEDNGVVLIKDATANKGGVTSSSLEVLAALALPEEDHDKLMCIQPDGSVPQFYQDYVRVVQETIEESARLEFEVIMREKQLHKDKHLCTISDEVSDKINKMNDMMQASPLLDNPEFVKTLLAKASPQLLQDHLGIDTIIERVPAAYIKAMCSCYFASRYVYQYGVSGNEIDVLNFMSDVQASV